MFCRTPGPKSYEVHAEPSVFEWKKTTLEQKNRAEGQKKRSPAVAFEVDINASNHPSERLPLYVDITDHEELINTRQPQGTTAKFWKW